MTYRFALYQSSRLEHVSELHGNCASLSISVEVRAPSRSSRDFVRLSPFEDSNRLSKTEFYSQTSDYSQQFENLILEKPSHVLTCENLISLKENIDILTMVLTALQTYYVFISIPEE